MTALADDRFNQSTITTKSRGFDSIAASVVLHDGAMVSMDSDGYCRPARATASDKVVGVCTRALPTQASAGAPASGGKVQVDSDSIHRFGNSATVDAITDAHVGRDCFVVDDQTVGLRSLAGARPRAGRVHKVDSVGVYVDFAAPAKLRVPVSVTIADVSAATDSNIKPSPIAGKVVEIITILQGAITSADAVVTGKIGATAITTGVLTIGYSGSAAGDVDFVHPSAANTVAAGSALKASSDGASSTSAVLEVTFVIEAD